MPSSKRRHATTRLRRTLLDWYDQNGRTLPWRTSPQARLLGQRPDPYAVWLSEIMLQQTTVPHATPYYHDFLDKWPTVHDLAAADRDDVLAAWAGLGYYARARNLMACAQVVSKAGGIFPPDESALLALPGIGPYTAAAIRAIAFDLPANVVDGNVERVVARVHAVRTALPKAKSELNTLAGVLANVDANPERPGDYAQALMDLGAMVCTPTSPVCEACPWSVWCRALDEGRPAEYPRRAPRKVRPRRYGVAYCVVRDGTIWLRTRPDEGLLGGMLEIPSTPWMDAAPQDQKAQDHAPFAASWSAGPDVRHVFTHFELYLSVWHATPPPDWRPDTGDFHNLTDIEQLALPSVMKKVIRAGISAQ